MRHKTKRWRERENEWRRLFMCLMSNMNIDLILTWYTVQLFSTWWLRKQELIESVCMCLWWSMFMKAFLNDWTGVRWCSGARVLMECILIVVVAAAHLFIPLEIFCGRVGDPHSDTHTHTPHTWHKILHYTWHKRYTIGWLVC